MFGYQLSIPLSPRELEHRRQNLDRVGLTAWTLPICLLVFIYCWRRLVSVLRPRHTTKEKTKSPGFVCLNLRRLSWLLSNPVSFSDFGDIRAHLSGFAYGICLLYLATRGTAPDYMHLTKSLAQVAVSQLPLQFLLAIKSPTSPIQTATGLSHELLNGHHRLMGRIIHLMLTCHGILYLNFFVRSGFLSKRVKDWDVQLGIASFGVLNVLTLLALPAVRRRAYHVLFYRSHIVLTVLLLLLIWFHVPYTRPYVLQAAIFYLLNNLTRRINSTNGSAVSIRGLRGTDLLSITACVDARHSLIDLVPGEHVYLKRMGGPFVPRTPFTVVSASESSRKDHSGNPMWALTFIARNLGGPQTCYFAEVADKSESINISLEGPYGGARSYVPMLLHPEIDNSRHVILVAGGVGGTYALPIYAAILRSRGSSRDTRFVWIVRTVQDASWGMELLNAMPCSVDAKIYVTRSGGISETASNMATVNSVQGLQIVSRHGRPDMGEIIKKTLAADAQLNSSKHVVSTRTRSSLRSVKRDYTPVDVLVCGPSSLARAVRKEAGRHVMLYGRDVRYHEEQFGHGSS